MNQMQRHELITYNVVKSILIFYIYVSIQFSTWVDAVIFVFSLENESSFNAVYNFYSKMTHFRNSAEIPIILVGTQGELDVVAYYCFVADNLLLFFASETISCEIFTCLLH